MRTARQISWVALALTCASLCLGAARAEGAEVYDGLTYAQFKSILSQTKLGLAESVTKKGNRYLTVTVPGATAPFVATVAACSAGQDQPCEGFAYIYIDTKHPMDTSTMGQFNRDAIFVKVVPDDASHPVLKGEFYARGGVAPQYVTHAGAFYTAVLETYLTQAAGAVAMNGRTPTPALMFAGRTRPEEFFAELAAKGNRQPAPAGATAPVIDEALIDAAVAPRH
jgi:hypothetical protein